MSKMKVETEVVVYELDGEDVRANLAISVESHWSDDKQVILMMGGKAIR